MLEPAPTPPPPSGPAHIEQKSFGKKDGRRRAGGRTAVEELTSEEREAVTIVFHQYETGLREGTIFTKVVISFTIVYSLYGYIAKVEIEAQILFLLEISDEKLKHPCGCSLLRIVIYLLCWNYHTST